MANTALITGSYGGLPDILINNAGFGGQGDFARERTMEQDMSMIAVNVEAPRGTSHAGKRRDPRA